MLRRRRILFAIFLFALAFAYLYDLGGTGVLEPDEPRYASIGREMAASGDWITPRLWHQPWFEKPPLLYWMAAVGNLLHLPSEWAARLPVTLLSVGFLILWFWLLREEFGEQTAAFSTAALAAAAGWLAYSTVCVTDIPLSVFFSLCVVLALRIHRSGGTRLEWCLLGASLGAAVLAKAFVPLVLILPAVWYLRSRWRSFWMPAASFAAIALPWYAAVWTVNGYEFIRVFFIEQQLNRVYSGALQHVQPFYFYVPALLGILFPVTPLLFALRPRFCWVNAPLRLLLTVVVFGFLFFSAAVNKLPGYLLPLLPSLCVLIGASMAKANRFADRRWLVAFGAAIALVPMIGPLIPVLLTSKIRSFEEAFIAILPITLGMLCLFLVPLAVAAFSDRGVAGALLILCVAVAIVHLKVMLFPILDQQVSARGLWREIAARSGQTCEAGNGLHREWHYGLAFYRGTPLPLCSEKNLPWALTQQGKQRPVLSAR